MTSIVFQYACPQEIRRKNSHVGFLEGVLVSMVLLKIGQTYSRHALLTPSGAAFIPAMRETGRPVDRLEGNGFRGGLWREARPLLLASKSLGRRLVLQQTGLPFEAHPAKVDERSIESQILVGGGGPDDVVAALSRAKALQISRRFPQSLVIGADQAASCAGKIFGKPQDFDAAKRQLRFLSGRSHRLHSGLALVRGGVLLGETVAHADLVLRGLTEEFLDCYFSSVDDTVLSSAGAYQVEGLGVHLFESIAGDHWTILGLPLLHLLALLRKLGALRG